MPTIIACPSCNRTLRVPDELLGKKVKCPSCGTMFTAAGAQPDEEDEPEEHHVTSRKPAKKRYDEDDFDADPPEEEEDEPEEEEAPRRRRRKRRRYMQPHRGTLILVLGILSVVGVASIILGPIAWVMGNGDLKEMRAGRMDPEGEGTTNAGRICGMIATILSIAALVCICGLFLVGFMGAALNAR